MTVEQERSTRRLAEKLFSSLGEPAVTMIYAHAMKESEGDYRSMVGYLNSWNSLRVQGERGKTWCEDRFVNILASAGVGCHKTCPELQV